MLLPSADSSSRVYWVWNLAFLSSFLGVSESTNEFWTGAEVVLLDANALPRPPELYQEPFRIFAWYESGQARWLPEVNVWQSSSNTASTYPSKSPWFEQKSQLSTLPYLQKTMTWFLAFDFLRSKATGVLRDQFGRPVSNSCALYAMRFHRRLTPLRNLFFRCVNP